MQDAEIISDSTSIVSTMTCTIPISLRLQSNVKGRKVDNILRLVKRQLLGVRIGDTVRKFKYLEEEKADFEEDVSRLLLRKSNDIITFVRESRITEVNNKTAEQAFTRLVEN